MSPHLSFSSSPYRSSPFISPSPYFSTSLFPHHDFSLPPVPRQLPNQTLSSELAVEFWIKALTAMVYVEILAALPTEGGFMFLTDSYCFPVHRIPAFHLFVSRFLIMPESPLRHQNIGELPPSPHILKVLVKKVGGRV